MQLVVCVILLTACGNPQQKVTEKWLKNNGEIVMGKTAAAVLGIKMNVSSKITNWEDHPIDTITYADFLIDWDIDVEERVYISMLQESTKHWRNVSTYLSYRWDNMAEEERYSAEFYSKAAKQHKANIDSLKALTLLPENKVPLYYVYQFTQTVKTKNMATGKYEKSEYPCYSYINVKTGEVAKVDESGKEYKMSVNKLSRE